MKKLTLKPDFTTTQRLVAKVHTLKTSSATYKKQTIGFVSANKKLSPIEEKEDDEKESLTRKRKMITRVSSSEPIVARQLPHISNILIKIVVKKKLQSLTKITVLHPTSKATSFGALKEVPLLALLKRKRQCALDKVEDFLGTIPEELVRKILKALLLETA